MCSFLVSVFNFWSGIFQIKLKVNLNAALAPPGNKQQFMLETLTGDRQEPCGGFTVRLVIHVNATTIMQPCLFFSLVAFVPSVTLCEQAPQSVGVWSSRFGQPSCPVLHCSQCLHLLCFLLFGWLRQNANLTTTLKHLALFVQFWCSDKESTGTTYRPDYAEVKFISRHVKYAQLQYAELLSRKFWIGLDCSLPQF